MKVTYLTRDHLLELRALEATHPDLRFNAAPSDEMLNQIPSSTRMNVWPAFPSEHNFVRVVCMAPWNDDVVPLTVDMPARMFDALPVLELDE